MKKFFLIALSSLLIVSCNVLVNYGYIPRDADYSRNFGIGAFLAPEQTLVYSEPDDNSRLIEEISRNRLNIKFKLNDLSARDAFIAVNLEKGLAVLPVIDEQDGWCQVTYDAGTAKSGWVECSKENFLLWREFMNKYGKEYDINFLKNTPYEFKKVRVAPEDEAEAIKNDFIYPEKMQVKFVRGNWMLVIVLDFNNSAPIGWIKWRDSEGKIYVFPNI